MKIILSDSQQHGADASFHWVPAEFRRNAPKGWTQRRRHAGVRRLLRGLPGKVLDYGCGYGDVAYEVSKTNDVHGVDVDPSRVAYANAEYAPIPFTVFDGDHLDFADASFDVVLSVVVIHFVADPVVYLREAWRVLRPGGQLAIICRQRSILRSAVRNLLRLKPVELATWVAPDGQSRHLWLPTRDELLDILAREKFSLVKSDYFSDPPSEIVGYWKDLPHRIPEQLLSMFSVGATANYFGLLLRKD